MERNSKDIAVRVTRANENADMAVGLLRRHPAMDEVFYARGSTSQHIYNRLKRPGGGYGFLVSIRFVQPAAAVAFYDALDVAKGPSLGTNFTLSCAYTLLAHYLELGWAKGFGVVEHMVRISFGTENKEIVKKGLVGKALAAVEEARGHC